MTGPIPYTFAKDASARDVSDRFDSLEDGQESQEKVSVAGRIMLLRSQGKVTFAQLRDSTGSVQLFVLAALAEDYEGFVKLSLGDWVGATGEVVRTRRGELSVKVDHWVLLAQARRAFGDKWKGITDTETRYRQRYADLWASPDSRPTLELRSRVIAGIRDFLGARGFMEVETPVLHPVPGGALARPFVTHHNALDADFYLRIAPELYLKRLVVGGFEKVYEIARVFRNEGLSTRHNPEFTMLELYQAYVDYYELMDLFENLVCELALAEKGDEVITYGGRQLDLRRPWRRATMVELIAEHAGMDVSLEMNRAELAERARSAGVAVKDSYGPGKLILEIYEKTTEAELWGPVFVCDYPKEVSPLARHHRDKPGWVERFEPILAGRELGNAFSELIDPDEQRARFEAQARDKAAGDDEAMVVDDDYLRAMEYGLPPTAGLGLGIDRLVMLLADAASIRQVIAFPALRPEVPGREGPELSGREGPERPGREGPELSGGECVE
ncbi:MAG: lysine--tRNA ligase [Acidimicrobiales bacterium]